jgi:hypothetical protein
MAEIVDHVIPQYGNHAPIEYERVKDVIGTDSACAEREQSHADHCTRDFTYAFANVDGTLTVDPMRSSTRWIRTDGDACRHTLTEQRRRQNELVALTTTLNSLRDDEPAARQFVPRATMLDALPKFSGYCLDNSTRGYNNVKSARVGKLPSLTEMIYKDRLPDTVDWVVERDVWREANARNRAFDCEGWCR